MKIVLRRSLSDLSLKRPSGGGAEVEISTADENTRIWAKVGPLSISFWHFGLVIPSIDVNVDILEIANKDGKSPRREGAGPANSGKSSWWKELLYKSCFINIGIVKVKFTLPGHHLGVDLSRVRYWVVIEKLYLAKAGPVSQLKWRLIQLDGQSSIEPNRWEVLRLPDCSVNLNYSGPTPEVQIVAEALRVEIPVLLYRETLLVFGHLMLKPDPEVSGDDPEKDVIDPSMPAVNCGFALGSLVVSVSDLAVGRCELLGERLTGVLHSEGSWPDYDIKIPSLRLDDIDLEGVRKTALRLDPAAEEHYVEVHGRGIYIDVDMDRLWGLIGPESFVAWFKAIDHMTDVFKSIRKPWKIVRRNELVKQYYAWELCRRAPTKEAVPYRYVPDPIRVRLRARSVEIQIEAGQRLVAENGFLMFDDQLWKFVVHVDNAVLYGLDNVDQKLITAKGIDVWVPLSVFPQLSRPLGPFPVVPDFVKNASAQWPERGALPIAVLFSDVVTKFDDALFGCINYLIEAAVHDIDRFPEVVDTGTRVFLDPPQFKSMLFVGTNVVADFPIPGIPPLKMGSLELAMGPTKDSMHVAVCRASIAGCLYMRNDIHVKVSCHRSDLNDPLDDIKVNRDWCRPAPRYEGEPPRVLRTLRLWVTHLPEWVRKSKDRNRKLALTAECSVREAALLAAGAVEAFHAFDREFTSTGPPKGPLKDLAVDLCGAMRFLLGNPSTGRKRRFSFDDDDVHEAEPLEKSGICLSSEAIHFTYLEDTKEMECTLTAVIVQMLPKVITACLPEAHFALLDQGTRAVVVLGTESVSPEIAAFENALSVSCRLGELQHLLEDLLVEYELASALGLHPPSPKRASRSGSDGTMPVLTPLEEPDPGPIPEPLRMVLSVEFLSGMCFTWAVRGLEPLQLLTADPISARLVFNTHGATGSPALVLPALGPTQDPILAHWLTEPWCLEQGASSSSTSSKGSEAHSWDIDSVLIGKLNAFMKGLKYLKDLKPGLIENAAVYSMGEGILDKPVYAQFDAAFTNPTMRWGAGSSISHVNSVQLRLLVHNLPSSPDAIRDTVDPPVCISWSAEFRDSASTGNQRLSLCVVPEFHIPMVLQLIGSPADFYQINGQNVRVSLNQSGKKKKRSLSRTMHRRLRTTSVTGVSPSAIFGNLRVAFNILLSEITCKCGAWRCGASEISLATDSSCATGSIVGSIRNGVIGFEVVRPHRLTPAFERHCAFCTPRDNPYPLRNVAPFVEIEDITLTLHSNLVPTFGAGRCRVSDDPHEVALLYLGVHGTRISWSPVIQRCMRMTLLNVDQFFTMMNRWRARFVEGLKYHDKMRLAEALARRPEAALSRDEGIGDGQDDVEEEEPLHVRIEKAWSAVMLVGRSASAVLRVSDVQLNCHYAAAADGKAATIEHEDTSTLSTTPSTPCGEEFKCGCGLLAGHAVYEEDYRPGEGWTWWIRQHTDDTPLPPLPPFNLSVAAASIEEIRLGAYPWKQIAKAIITNDELGFDDDLDINEREDDSIAGKLPNGAQLVLCIGEAIAEVRAHRTSTTVVDSNSNLRVTLALTLDGLRGLVGSTKPYGVAWSGSYGDTLTSVTELSKFTLRGTADILPVGDSSVQAYVDRIFLAADDLSFHQVVSVITECLLYRPGTHEDDDADTGDDELISRSVPPSNEPSDAPVTLTERISPGELKRLRSEISDVVSEDFGDGSPSGSKLVIEYSVGELTMNLAHADSVFLKLKLDEAAGTHVFAHSDPGHPMMFSFELRDITVTGNEGMQIIRGAHSRGTSLLQFRGQDRIMQHNGQRWHIYDAVTVNLAPIVVNSTQQMFEEVYAFIFLDPTGEDMSLSDRFKTKEDSKNDKPAELIFFKYIRFGDINALFSYKSKRMTLKDVSLKVRHYVRKRRLWTWRDCLDEWGSRFFHQALSSVVLHPFSRKPKYFGGEHIVSREEVARALFGKYAPANTSIAPRMPVSPRDSSQSRKHRLANGPGPPPSRSHNK